MCLWGVGGVGLVGWLVGRVVGVGWSRGWCSGCLPSICLPDSLRRVVVNGREGVVKEDEVTIKVGAAGEVQALALAAGEVDAAEAGLGGWFWWGFGFGLGWAGGV
jgi:hypothetical protein